MKKGKLFIAALLLAISFNSYAQMPAHLTESKLIAVVNTADWCRVCKENGARFGAVLTPYASNGVNIYLNDLSNNSTKVASQEVLEKAGVYKATTTIPRKGMGKMLKACGIVKDKKQKADVAGVVTFINAKTHKQVKQVSISIPDAEMQEIITNLLK